MPLRHQNSKNHKGFILNKLHFVNLNALSGFVAKNVFSEETHISDSRLIAELTFYYRWLQPTADQIQQLARL